MLWYIIFTTSKVFLLFEAVGHEMSFNTIFHKLDCVVAPQNYVIFSVVVMLFYSFCQNRNLYWKFEM